MVSKNIKNDWKVTKNKKILSTHKTQGDAIQEGIRRAKQIGNELVTHARDGKIRSKDSYENDPIPLRDKEN